tara:strand:+ start:2809 stop:3684 length:876 start_codon:yes stop_codon:yes gene_type:complete
MSNELGFTYKDEVLEIIDGLELGSKTDNSILKSRFLSEVLNYEKRKLYTRKYYNIFRFVVTTGSILLPAVLSLGQMDPAKLPKNFDTISYWISWTISLSVTASNGFLQLFSLDKNYFEYAITTEQLKTEGWQYFQLSGKYDDYESHREAYRPFCKSIENIKRKQVEKEFSGKGEVKKKKEFDFKKELSSVLPDKFEKNMNTKIEDRLKDDKILSLLNGLSAVATQGSNRGLNENSKELKENLQGTIMKQVGNTKDIVQSVVQDVIDKSEDKLNESVENITTIIEEAEPKKL